MEKFENTGYAAQDHVADVDNFFEEKQTVPAGTLTTLALLPFELDLTEGKERLKARFEVVAPEQYEGLKFEQAMFLSNVPFEGGAPQNTSYFYTLAIICRIVAAIKQISSKDATEYVTGQPRDGDSVEACVRGWLASLEPLVGQHFTTKIAARVEIDKATKRPKLNPNTGREWPPKQQVGAPVYPKADTAQERAA